MSNYTLASSYVKSNNLSWESIKQKDFFILSDILGMRNSSFTDLFGKEWRLFSSLKQRLNYTDQVSQSMRESWELDKSIFLSTLERQGFVINGRPTVPPLSDIIGEQVRAGGVSRECVTEAITIYSRNLILLVDSLTSGYFLDYYSENYKSYSFDIFFTSKINIPTAKALLTALDLLDASSESALNDCLATIDSI